MRPWWPQTARTAWSQLRGRRKARARSIVHWLLCEFDGQVRDQRALLDLLERKDELAPGPAIETVRHLVRLGLLRRKRAGSRTRLWLPGPLRAPPGGSRGSRPGRGR